MKIINPILLAIVEVILVMIAMSLVFGKQVAINGIMIFVYGFLVIFVSWINILLVK